MTGFGNQDQFKNRLLSWLYKPPHNTELLDSRFHGND
jgi:hypothetical protein